jgi:hypothetical protein
MQNAKFPLFLCVIAGCDPQLTKRSEGRVDLARTMPSRKEENERSEVNLIEYCFQPLGWQPAAAPSGGLQHKCFAHRRLRAEDVVIAEQVRNDKNRF